MKYIRKFVSYSDAKSSVLVSPTLATFGADSEKVYMKNIYDEQNYKIIGNLDKLDIALTVEWLVETTKEDKVKIAGNCVLNKKVDVYSIEFLEGAHLTIGPEGRLRIWEGGIANNDCETVNYFTVKNVPDGDLHKSGQVLLHPDVITNTNPLATVEYLSKSYGTSAANNAKQALSMPFKENAISNITTNLSNKITQFDVWRNNSWDLIGRISNTSTIKYAKFDIPNAHYCITSNNTSFEEMPLYPYITGKLRLNGNQNNISILKGYTCFGNSYCGTISMSKFLQALEAQNPGINSFSLYCPDNTLQFVTINSSNVSLYPYYPSSCTGQIINNTGAVKSFNFNYKDLVWDPSFEEEIIPVQMPKLAKAKAKSLSTTSVSDILNITLPDFDVFD